MSEVRTIKKYPNRRLYDTAISSYVTLQDVKALVVSSTAFRVIDAKSGNDLTRPTLLQLLQDEEENGRPVFNTQTLIAAIRDIGTYRSTEPSHERVGTDAGSNIVRSPTLHKAVASAY